MQCTGQEVLAGQVPVQERHLDQGLIINQVHLPDLDRGLLGPGHHLGHVQDQGQDRSHLMVQVGS